MSFRKNFLWILLIALSLHGANAEPLQVVLQSGRSIPVSALSLEGDKFVVQTTTEGFTVGQSFPLTMADHIYGESPVEINQALALVLTGKAKEAEALLLPVVKRHSITAQIPGNFWIDAARVLLVAYAIHGDVTNTTDFGKKISDATAAQGTDSFAMLGKALLMPALSSKAAERELALRDLTTENHTATLCAYASFFCGNILKKEMKTAEALEAYLAVPCLHPSGSFILNAAAELQAADLLAALGRHEEALALVESALRVSTGTVLADEANTRITSLKK